MWTNTVSNVGQQGSVIPGSGLDERANPSEPLKVEYWPFTLRIARNGNDLKKVIEIRHSAYARHLPGHLSSALQKPEALDQSPAVALLLAESNLDGSAVGTMRIQTNAHGPLALEQSVTLPSWMKGKALAEATRLGVVQQTGSRLIKTALFKAYYEYCLHQGVDYMVITARAPLDRQYVSMLFKDVFPGVGFQPLSHVFGLPHRVMYLSVKDVRRQWEEVDHPLRNFMFHTEHPLMQLAMG